MKASPFSRLSTLVAVILPISALASPVITEVTAKQRYPWNDKVDIICTVSGIAERGGKWAFAVSTVNPDSGIVDTVSHVRVLREGMESDDLSISTNGDYRLVWNAAADLGEKATFSNMVVRVNLASDRGKVQLWADGPYWAETNIGADKPWDYGYYFWWGDAVGFRYDYENGGWDASDGSSQDFIFDVDTVPTYGKDSATLQSLGWITADGVLVPEHDAAQMQWGEGWRMPTDSELSALNGNCDWTYTITNGVRGWVVRGRNGFSRASIFLPAAGSAYKNYLHEPSWGHYWSSGLIAESTEYSYAICFNAGFHSMCNSARSDGRSIRPVLGVVEVPGGCSAPFPLDTRTGIRLARTTEPLSYSTLWNDSDGVSIAIDGTEVFAAAAPASGDYAWDVSAAASGLHALTLSDGVETLSAWFSWKPAGAESVFVEGVAIPIAWLEEEAADILAANDGEHAAAAVAMAANCVNEVWQCYVAGLCPTNASERFLATVRFDTNGLPEVRWAPDLNEGGTKRERIYTVEGKTNLVDKDWGPTNEATRFFRVKVEMPQ